MPQFYVQARVRSTGVIKVIVDAESVDEIPNEILFGDNIGDITDEDYEITSVLAVEVISEEDDETPEE